MNLKNKIKTPIRDDSSVKIHKLPTKFRPFDINIPSYNINHTHNCVCLYLCVYVYSHILKIKHLQTGISDHQFRYFTFILYTHA